jgi:long-chain alkane monooxygenase
MPRQIRLNAFDMNCVGHQSPGLWTHPRDRADRYNTLDYWVELARILERGKFDALFLADVLGVYDVYRGLPDAANANAVQVPVNDPLLLVPAMAYVTRDLGFGVTCAVSYEHPYTLARRFATLDHLTGGRIGWNVVTGYLNSAAKGVGLARQPEHDTRYEIAEEYMQIVYKLWEGSWEDGAVLRDRAQRLFARPQKRCVASGMTARIFGSKPSTCANPRRNARRCSIKRARPRAAANSPPRTPNACSSMGP